jgi:hypothetical protein
MINARDVHEPDDERLPEEDEEVDTENDLESEEDDEEELDEEEGDPLVKQTRFAKFGV